MIILGISKNLSRLTKGDEAFEVEGGTLGECLQDFVSMVPRIENELFISSGDRLVPRVEVRVNRKILAGEDILDRKINDGDEIEIALKGH
jgi:molybdopterin converting factor small subunit